jgi:hypothetical protein
MAIRAAGQITIIDLNDITVSSTAPSSPSANQLWLDTSVTPNVLKKYSGSAWAIVSDPSDAIADAVANIQIGGTNLVKGSSFLYTALPANANFAMWSVNNVSGSGFTANGYHYLANFDNGAPNSSMGIKIDLASIGVKIGDTITCSADVKGTFGTDNHGLCVMHATSSWNVFYAAIYFPEVYPTSIPNWTRKTLVYTIPSNMRVEADGTMYLHLFWGGGTGSAVDVYTKNTKIELGNKPTAWSPAPDDIANSVQVGGRNLLPNSNFTYGWTGWWANLSTGHTKETDDLPTGASSALKFACSYKDYGIYYGNFTALSNQAYTLSFYAKASATVTFNAGYENVVVSAFTATTTWQKYTVAFTGTGIKHAVIFYPQTAVTYFYITNIKLETGTRATDWTAAPEDVAADINTAQTTANNAATAASNAQTSANTAQSTADSKRTVFTSTPTVPYKSGDLWLTSTASGQGDLYKCIANRTTGSYTASEWVRATKYTDDTTVNNLVIGGTNLLKNTSNPTDGTYLVAGNSSYSAIYADSVKGNVFERSTTGTNECFIYSSRTPRVDTSTQYTISCDIWANSYVSGLDLFWLSDTDASQQTGSGVRRV